MPDVYEEPPGLVDRKNAARSDVGASDDFFRAPNPGPVDTLGL